MTDVLHNVRRKLDHQNSASSNHMFVSDDDGSIKSPSTSGKKMKRGQSNTSLSDRLSIQSNNSSFSARSRNTSNTNPTLKGNGEGLTRERRDSASSRDSTWRPFGSKSNDNGDDSSVGTARSRGYKSDASSQSPSKHTAKSNGSGKNGHNMQQQQQQNSRDISPGRVSYSRRPLPTPPAPGTEGFAENASGSSDASMNPIVTNTNSFNTLSTQSTQARLAAQHQLQQGSSKSNHGNSNHNSNKRHSKRHSKGSSGNGSSGTSPVIYAINHQHFYSDDSSAAPSIPNKRSSKSRKNNKKVKSTGGHSNSSSSLPATTSATNSSNMTAQEYQQYQQYQQQNGGGGYIDPRQLQLQYQQQQQMHLLQQQQRYGIPHSSSGSPESIPMNSEHQLLLPPNLNMPPPPVYNDQHQKIMKQPSQGQQGYNNQLQGHAEMSSPPTSPKGAKSRNTRNNSVGGMYISGNASTTSSATGGMNRKPSSRDPGNRSSAASIGSLGSAGPPTNGSPHQTQTSPSKKTPSQIANEEHILLREEPERGHALYDGNQKCRLFLTNHMLYLVAYEGNMTHQISNRHPGAGRTNGGGLSDSRQPPKKIIAVIPADSITGILYQNPTSQADVFDIEIYYYPNEREENQLNNRMRAKVNKRVFAYKVKPNKTWFGETIDRYCCGSSNSANQPSFGTPGSHKHHVQLGRRHREVLHFQYRDVTRQDCRHLATAIQHLIRMTENTANPPISPPNKTPIIPQSPSIHGGNMNRNSMNSIGSSPSTVSMSFSPHNRGSYSAFPQYNNRHFLIFVSGSKGDQLCLTRNIEPMLQEGCIEYHSVTLHNVADAHEVITSFSTFQSYDVMIILGSDYFVTNVIQEIMLRDDGSIVLNDLPIVPITRKLMERNHWYSPTSHPSAAALMKSVMARSHMAVCDPLHATFLAIRGRPQPMDLSRVALDTGEVIYSSLQLGWGMINHDEMSGSILPVWMTPKMFTGSISMKLVRNPPMLRDRILSAMVNVASGSSPSQSMKKGNTPGPGGSGAVGAGSPLHSQQSMVASMVEVNKWEDGDERENQDNPLSIRIRGSFAFIWIVQTTHSKDSQQLTGPGARMDDGVFTVYIVHEMSRLKLYSIFKAIKAGKHVFHKSVRVFQCTHYSLDPDEEDDNEVYIDGISFPFYRNVTGDILPGKAKVMVLPNVR